VTRKTLTRGHVAFDASGFCFVGKIAVRLDSPYLQQIAYIRKMSTYAIACRNFILHFITGFINLGYSTLVQQIYWLWKVLLVYALQSAVLLECVQLQS
jgi:hypothetical protein